MGAGYKTLEFVLIDLHKGKPSRELLHSLLDMLVDGSFQPSNMVIQVVFPSLYTFVSGYALHLPRWVPLCFITFYSNDGSEVYFVIQFSLEGLMVELAIIIL